MLSGVPTGVFTGLSSMRGSVHAVLAFCLEKEDAALVCSACVDLTPVVTVASELVLGKSHSFLQNIFFFHDDTQV